MEILFLLIIVALYFIVYKMNKLEKVQHILADAATNFTQLSTSLNPLFSEKEIAECRSISEKLDKKVKRQFDILQRTEKEEIVEHQSFGRDKSGFAPSTNLKATIQRLSVAIISRNTMDARARQMIEANISILNGKSISEISEYFHQFLKQQGYVPWENIFLDDSAWSNTPTIKKEFEDFLAERSEFWQNSWNSILSEDYLAKEQE